MRLLLILALAAALLLARAVQRGDLSGWQVVRCYTPNYVLQDGGGYYVG